MSSQEPSKDEWTQKSEGWKPPVDPAVQKKESNMRNSEIDGGADLYHDPLGSFAEDSPPRPRLAPQPSNAPPVFYPPQHPPPPQQYHPHPYDHDMYPPHHNMYQHQPPPPSPYRHEYDDHPQFAYQPYAPMPTRRAEPPPGSWRAHPNSRVATPTQHRDRSISHKPEAQTLYTSPNLPIEGALDERLDLGARLSPMDPDFDRFESTDGSMGPLFVQRFTVGASSGDLENINNMIMQHTGNSPAQSTPARGGQRLTIPHNYPPTPQIVNKKPTPAKRRKKVLQAKKDGCNCKKTRCLKLYCECFAAKKYCKDFCKCTDCHNNENHQTEREKAMQAILDRNENAFEAPAGVTCRCKRSACLKKYCECFGAGVVCGEECKCVNCENRAGSQLLIDKRREMNDEVGAKYAMDMAASVWSKPKPKAQMVRRYPPYTPSPHPNMVQSPAHHMSRGHTGQGFPIPPYYRPHEFITPMPEYSPHHPHGGPPSHYAPAGPPLPYPPYIVTNTSSNKRSAREITPGTPRIRKRNQPTEPSIRFFGANNRGLSKRAVTNVLGFLSNEDTYNAVQVSKQWKTFIVALPEKQV